MDKFKNCLSRSPIREKCRKNVLLKDTTEWLELVLNREHVDHKHCALMRFNHSTIRPPKL